MRRALGSLTYWLRARKPLLTVLLFLLLGLVANVAVAWGCAAVINPRMAGADERVGGSHLGPDHSRWFVRNRCNGVKASFAAIPHRAKRGTERIRSLDVCPGSGQVTNHVPSHINNVGSSQRIATTSTNGLIAPRALVPPPMRRYVPNPTVTLALSILALWTVRLLLSYAVGVHSAAAVCTKRKKL